ncbi:MAG: CAP domain-containing protein [Actinomycetota bacterium]|nr:CAP domain-containing protein [Actinomycetota bacterium]
MTRNKQLGAALAALAFTLGTLAFVSPAGALTNCSVSGDDAAVDAEEARMLDLVNDYRAKNGLSSLSLDANVTRAAAWFSRDMAMSNYFPYDHVDRLGRDIGTRLTNCDAVFTAWAENIAAGNASAAATFEQWRTSTTGHNENMLRSNVTRAGIGRAFNAASTFGWYWTLDLTNGSTGTSSPSNTSTPLTGVVAPTPPPDTQGSPGVRLPPSTAIDLPPPPDVGPTTGASPTADVPGTTDIPSTTDGGRTANVPVKTDSPDVAEATDPAASTEAPAVLASVCAMLEAVAVGTGGQVAAVQQAVGGTLGLAQLQAVIARVEEVRNRISADIDAARAAAGCTGPVTATVGELDLITAATAS